MQFRWLLLLALGLTLASNALAMLGPKLSGSAIDCIAREEGVDFAGVGRYCLLMLLFYVGSSLLSYLLSILMVHISRRVTLRMRRDLFERLCDMPVGFVDTHPVGDLISRIFYDTDTINTSLSSDVVHILASLITIVGSFFLMLSISPRLVLVFAVTIPLSLFITGFISRRTQPLFRLRSRKMGELNDFSEEMITGMKTLKAYHQEENTLSSLDRLNEEVVQSYYKSEYYSSVMGPSVNLINNLSLSMISAVRGADVYGRRHARWGAFPPSCNTAAAFRAPSTKSPIYTASCNPPWRRRTGCSPCWTSLWRRPTRRTPGPLSTCEARWKCGM